MDQFATYNLEKYLIFKDEDILNMGTSQRKSDKVKMLYITTNFGVTFYSLEKKSFSTNKETVQKVIMTKIGLFSNIQLQFIGYIKHEFLEFVVWQEQNIVAIIRETDPKKEKEKLRSTLIVFKLGDSDISVELLGLINIDDNVESQNY